MSDELEPEAWRFCRFGLLVTGKGERRFLPQLFRQLSATGSCTFEVIRWLGQRSHIASPKRKQKMVGSGKIIPDRDEEEIGIPARKYLQEGLKDGRECFVLLIDDSEHDRTSQIQEDYARYRMALDTILGPFAPRASVHFLVNMLEAYYFAHSAAINAVHATALADYGGDVECIPHPKNDLKKLIRGFDEVIHGEQILKKLDTTHVLSNPKTCKSLRTIFAWCWEALGLARSDLFQLAHGELHPLTSPQIAALSAALRPPTPSQPPDLAI